MATADYPTFTNDKADELIAQIRRIANADESSSGASTEPVWDATNGCYTNASLKSWLGLYRDGREYGVSIPLDASTKLTKLGANAGIAVPTISVGSTAGNDPYQGVGPFLHFDVNGYCDADGTPHVTAIEGDGHFSNTDADTFVLTPVVYVRYVLTDDDMQLWWCDTWKPGYSAQPQAMLPDGTMRPYILYAKYPLGYVNSGLGAGHAASRSGLQPWTNSGTNKAGASCTPVSHNGLISIMANSTTGYSGRSVADDWYMKCAFWLKYATKNSQAYFPQCSNYYDTAKVTAAGTNTDRVTVSAADAAKFVDGSSVTVGTTNNNASPDYRIKSIVSVDSSNSDLVLDGYSGSPTTSMTVYTKPWFSGACDGVAGDGVAGSGDKYPCKLQGIEFGHGITEVVGDVIVSNDGETGWVPYVCHDSRNESTAITSNYRSCAKPLPTDSYDSWKYPKAPDNVSEGLLFGSETGGGSSSGLCDGNYTNKMATTGTREWQALGDLGDVSNAGLCYVVAPTVLGDPWWYIGSRLSLLGRSRG